MHIPVNRLVRSLNRFLVQRIGVDVGYGSNEEAALAAIRLVEVRANAGVAQYRQRFSRLSSLLDDITRTLDLDEAAPELAKALKSLQDSIAAKSFEGAIEAVDAEETDILAKLETVIDQLASDRRLAAPERQRAALLISHWDSTRLAEQIGGADVAIDSADTVITADSLRLYLQDRFAEDGLEVTDFTRVSGGFGKETIIFSASGSHLNGEFVLRRDRSRPLLDNDCHNVVVEYPVIEAVAGKGFPAPEVVWLDTDHRLLPGSDFFVMKRSPGKPRGDVFGGTQLLPPEMVKTLADTVAELHRLDALENLGDITDSIRSELWSMPLGDVIYRYIRGYYDYYLTHRTSHLPALVALYGWLFNNVPPAPGRPVLVHGDLGLQNLLFDGDRLSVVLDWELAHVGDPIEDIAYIWNTANASLDWPAFLAEYETAFGEKISAERLHYFRVWGHVRNATAAAIAADCYSSGELNDFNISHIGFFYTPRFIDEAVRLIGERDDVLMQGDQLLNLAAAP